MSKKVSKKTEKKAPKQKLLLVSKKQEKSLIEKLKKAPKRKEYTKKQFEEAFKKDIDPILNQLTKAIKKHEDVNMGYLISIQSHCGHTVLIAEHYSDQYKARAIDCILKGLK